jgi:hypothetical protein
MATPKSLQKLRAKAAKQREEEMGVQAKESKEEPDEEEDDVILIRYRHF